ncbi:MAG: U32 family peptidase, partial [Deltaproteobacteria bacterium]|nr:U32 family peptidase [Deltaproteobacteria bacterium]
SRDAVKYNIGKTGIEAEVFAHGKVPLAFSWRCYASRAHGLTKTGCRHHCAEYPDGMEIRSLDGEPLFTVNGTSLLGAGIYTLIEFVDDLREIGVKALRISPQKRDTGRVVEIFRRRAKGEMTSQEALDGLKTLYDTARFSNGWYLGGAGKDYLTGEWRED